MDTNMPIAPALALALAHAKTEEMAVAPIHPMACAPSLDAPRDPLAPFKAVAAVALASGPHRLACESDLEEPRDPLAAFKAVMCCFPEFTQEKDEENEEEDPEWTQEDEEEDRRQTRLEERLEIMREEFRNR
jgi:hypothetical protein